jgi:hypothetical protein
VLFRSGHLETFLASPECWLLGAERTKATVFRTFVLGGPKLKAKCKCIGQDWYGER